MAVTYSDGGVANTIAARTEMITSRMDEIIKKEAVTNAMTASPELQDAFRKSETAKLATMTTSGLGNYDKVKGYPIGSVSVSWKDYTLAYDRALEIDIDRKDALQTGGLATAAAAAAQSLRQNIIPEIDATRLSQAMAKTKTALPAHVIEETAAPTAANLLSKIGEGLDAIYEERGVDTGATIYINNKLKSVLRSSTEYTKVKSIDGSMRSLDLNTQSIDGNPIVFVPQARMKTAYTYQDVDGTNNGGIAPASNAQDINFLIAAPGCAQGVVVIQSTKYFPADQNQRKDADMYQFRIYHDLIVETNSGATGIYVHAGKASEREDGTEGVVTTAAKARTKTSK